MSVVRCNAPLQAHVQSRTAHRRTLGTPARWDTNRQGISLDRVSDDRDRGHEIIAARERMADARKLAEARRVELIEELSEMGVSGDNERDVLEHALGRIEAGDAAWLVCHSVDRLTREGVLGLGEILRRLDAAGAALLLYSPLVDSTDDGSRAVMQIMAALAEMERRRITRWWGRSQEAAWRHGKYPGELCAGLRNPTAEEYLAYCAKHQIDPATGPGHAIPQHVREEVRAIRAGAAALLAGSTASTVARVLTEQLGRGGKQRTDKQTGEREWSRGWSVPGVKALLCNRMLIGEVTWKGHTVIDACEAILTHAQFEAIQALRGERSDGGDNSPKHLLADSLARCAGCGFSLIHRTSRGYRTYYCRTKDCEEPVRNADATTLERIVEDAVFAMHKEEVANLLAVGAHEGLSLERIDAELAELRARKNKYAMLLTEDPDDPDLKAGFRKLKADAAAKLAERRTAERALAPTGADALSFRDVYDSEPVSSKRQALGAVIECVMVKAAPAGGFAWVYPLRKGTIDVKKDLPGRGRLVAPRRFVVPHDAPRQLGVTPARDGA